MKTLRFFLGLIALLFVLCLVTGCRTPSLSFGWDSTNGWEVGPWQQYPEGRPPKIEPDPEAEPEPELEATEEGTQPEVTLPTGAKLRSGPSGLRGDTPIPVGPPGPGRQMAIPMSWQHTPSLDGTTEYRVYHSRQVDTNKWDGFETVAADAFHTTGRRFEFRYRQGGTIRFVATARRPPDVEAGETEWAESDPSNAITVRAKGFPEPPTELAPKR